MDENWFYEKLQNLRIKENRLATLTELRDCLNEEPNVQASVTGLLLTSPEIFDCIDEDQESDFVELADVVNDILCICMAKITLSQSDIPSLLQRALLNKHPRIRALALNTILKALQDNDDDVELGDSISEELLCHVLNALQESETQLGCPASAILSLVLSRHLETPNVKDILLKALKKNEVVKCRLYELAANLGKRSAGTFEKVEFILDHALSDLDNDDILLHVNILQILVELAEKNHGLVFLEKRRVFDIISTRVEEMEHSPLDRLLIPGIMIFFGKICSIQPQKIINGYPRMLQCLFDCLDSGDVSILPVAFDTFANVTHSQEGVLLLDRDYGTAVKDVLGNYYSYLRTLPIDLKNRALSSLELVFTFESKVSLDISSILKRWFNYLNGGSSSMQFLMEFCANPFPDIKISALNLIGCLCLYVWGIEALKNTAGLLEYLLDRKVEFDKDAKYAKFCVVKILADSSAFSVQNNTQLRSYINEGPYFVQTVMDVAVEGNQ